MHIEKPSILETCSETTKTALLLYCDYINRSDAAVFVVMAQKAFCLFQILMEEGLLRKDIANRFYSSSALEFGYEDFEDKKVAIVDDIIISGSAIASAAYKLFKYGKVSDENIEIIALARDIDYQTMQFTSIKDRKSLIRCALDVNDAECIQISYEISHILAYRGRPYNADFPVYNKIEIGKNIYKDIQNSLDWKSYDITNDVQKEGNIQSITLFPHKAIKDKLWRLLGIDMSEFLHLKIRIYIQHYECEKDIMEIVPMAWFHETSEKEIDTLISHFSNLGVYLINKIRNNHYTTKVNVLQFYIAHALKIAFVSRINSSGCNLIPQIIYHTFGSSEAKNIINCLEQIEEKKDVIYISKEEVETNDMEYESRFECEILGENDDEEGLAINEALYQAIQYVYETRELPAREALKSPVRHFLLDFEIIEKQLKRLYEGFSLNALKEIIKAAGDLYYLEQLVSLFIDRSIDEGVAVPITYYNEEKHYVCRAHRHGEDLPFGDADRKRILCFLKYLDAGIRDLNGDKEEFISSVAFEKIIVLFYQIGMKKRYHIFNRFLGFNNYPVLQQRFSVHGVVATYNERDEFAETHVYLEGMDQKTHMLNVFLQSSPDYFIIPDDEKKKTYYIIQSNSIETYLNKSKLNNISKEIDDNIKEIATIIGSWYWFEHIKPRNEFRDDITALTSCKDIYTYASAVAASIHYFKEYWEGEAKGALVQIKQGNGDQNFYSGKFDPVLPSGRKKHEWFMKDKASSVIVKVGKILTDNGMQENAKIWGKIWSGDSYTLRGDDLRQYAHTATQYIYFYSACYEWLRQQWFLKDDKKDSFLIESQNAKKYLQQCKEIETGYDDVVNHFLLFDTILEKSSQIARIDNLMERMSGIINQSEGIITKIEEGIRESSAIYRIMYTSVIIVDIELDDNEMADEFFLKIWERIYEDEKKTYINIISLGIVDERYFRYGVFHEKHTEEVIQYLLEIYARIHSLACEYACKTRTILIPMLRNNWVLSHDLRNNISKYARDFSEKISELTSGIQFSDYIHQFSFIQTWMTSRELYGKVKDFLKDYNELEGKQSIDVPSIDMKFDCYQFVCGRELETNKLSYSTVYIEVNDKFVGTGLLFCYEEKIYCVTCQHLLGKEEFSGSVKAIIDCSNERINLEPVNYSANTNRVAWEDVLILEPKITRFPELDRNNMFHKEDCIEKNSEELKEGNYSLYGFGLADPSYGRWVRDIKLIGGVKNRYYQMNGREPLGPGDSGAAIISNNPLKILGIHAKSFDKAQTQTLMIPAWNILDVLGRVYNRREM